MPSHTQPRLHKPQTHRLHLGGEWSLPVFRLPSSSCSLAPGLSPHHPHSFLLTPVHPPTQLLTGSHRGSSPPTSPPCSLCNSPWSVLSDASPPSHRVPPLSPPPLSPQTFLASSGGLYCLGGGCGNVVIPGCMSLPSSPASSALQLACPGLAAGLHGADALRAPCPEQAPEGPVGGGWRLCATRVCMGAVGSGALCWREHPEGTGWQRTSVTGHQHQACGDSKGQARVSLAIHPVSQGGSGQRPSGLGQARAGQGGRGVAIESMATEQLSFWETLRWAGTGRGGSAAGVLG